LPSTSEYLMTDDIPPDGGSSHTRSSVALTRTSFFKFVGLLTGVFVLAGYLLIYLAHDLNHTEELKGAFYTEKAVQSLEKSLRSTVRDYAFWGDAYRHLHHEVDADWAYVRQNIGPTLYGDFGLQGLFVVNDTDHTVYSVIRGQFQSTPASSWLGQSLASVLTQARAGAEAEEPVTTLISIDGQPAITPGTDPTVQPDGRQPSVLIFVRVLDPPSLEQLGKEYGIAGLRTATAVQHGPVFALGENGAAGSLRWDPERPGQHLLGVGFSLLGITALLVCLLAWALWRRTCQRSSLGCKLSVVATKPGRSGSQRGPFSRHRGNQFRLDMGDRQSVAFHLPVRAFRGGHWATQRRLDRHADR
jgi:sensor domain CHASE-containing protein